MANRATIKYNGNTITEDREGGFVVNYNGNNLTTVSAGETRTFKCKDKYMKSVFKVGGRTLKCLDKLMATDVVVSVVSLFPANPSSYNLIGTYTSSGSFTAPSNGWFQIELQGASGYGGSGGAHSTYIGLGGGGGGGGCAISRVKMNKGDTISYSLGAANSKTSTAATVAGNSTATINSSFNEYAHTLTVTGANNGVNASTVQLGKGGAGGIGSGGNYANYTGGTGDTPPKYSFDDYVDTNISGVNGGNAGYSGGNVGGKGSGWDGKKYNHTSAGAGANAFIKIYAGNTN